MGDCIKPTLLVEEHKILTVEMVYPDWDDLVFPYSKIVSDFEKGFERLSVGPQMYPAKNAHCTDCGVPFAVYVNGALKPEGAPFPMIFAASQSPADIVEAVKKACDATLVAVMEHRPSDDAVIVFRNRPAVTLLLHPHGLGVKARVRLAWVRPVSESICG